MDARITIFNTLVTDILAKINPALPHSSIIFLILCMEMRVFLCLEIYTKKINIMKLQTNHFCKNFIKAVFLGLFIILSQQQISYAQPTLFGMTSEGGMQFGSIFGIPTGGTSLTKQYNFEGIPGKYPQHTKLTQSSNGKLYGMTYQGGANNQGVLFEYDANSNIYSKKFEFSDTDGTYPYGSLIEASNGKLYGLTTGGGLNRSGVLFEYDANSNIYTKKFEFSNATGRNPFGSLIEASNGKMYGMTQYGGANGLGVLFEYDAVNNVYTKKFDFSTPNGVYPEGSLIETANGKLYGMTPGGGANNQGVLFEYDVSINVYTKKVDYSFLNGINPYSSMIKASNGKLYGLTLLGGANNQGVLFEYDANSNVYSKRFDFSSTNGSNPRGSLMEAVNGKLYGMTQNGGVNASGVLFEYNMTNNSYSKKFDFSPSNASSPFGSLIEASNSKLYGMTNQGGVNGLGVLFEYNTSNNVYIKKHDFSSANGSNPRGSLIEASNGKLYGMTVVGGASNQGVLFEYDANINSYTKKFDFSAPNGIYPEGSLIEASNGKLYGMTSGGGTNGLGVLFEYDVNSTVYTKKYDFSTANGSNPRGSLIEVTNGKLYGMTYGGGASNQGVLFEYDVNSNVYTKKYDFSGNDGNNPTGSLVKANNGKLYGMTSGGGTTGFSGVLFEYDATSNVFSKKFDFDFFKGSTPQGSLSKAANGKLYGMTSGGGTNGWGVLFEYDANSNIYTKKFEFSGATGYRPIYTNLIEVNLIPPCINPTVPMLSATNNVICSGNSTSLSIGTGSLNSATNWQWYSGSCGGTTEGSGASITVSPTSTTTYYARGEGGCVTPDLCASITVTVNPNVNAGVVTGVANLCIGGTATYTSNGDPGGSWSSSNELAATVNVSTGLVTALSAGTTTITYTINTGCTAPQSASTSLTVNPNVNAGVVTGTGNLCNGGTTTFTSNGDGGGSWSSSNEAVATVDQTTGLVTGITAGTALIIYNINTGCGAPAIASAPISIASGASPVVTGLTNVCPIVGTSTTATYTANSIGASSYNWVVPPNVVIQSGQGTASLMVIFLSGFSSQANKQLKVTATSVCGVSAQTIYYLLAQFPSTPAPINASSSDVCPILGTGNTISFTIPKATAASSYLWAAQPGTTSISHPNGPGANDTTVTVTFSSGFTTSAITVRAVNECGTSQARSFSISRNNPSTPSLISGPTIACEYIAPNGIPATYSIPAVANATNYTWSVPIGAIGLSGQGTNSISFTYPPGFTNGSITVRATNGCGTSSVRTLAIGTLLPSTPGVIDVINTVSCPNRIYTYTLASLPANATSVNWVATAGTIINGQGTSSITVSYPPTAVSGMVTAQGRNNCGNSVIRTTTVKLPACEETPPLFARSTAEPVSSFNILPDKMELNVYPNPSTSDFKLRVITAVKEKIGVRVLDMTGRLYRQITIMPYQTINLGSELHPGAYMIEVKQSGMQKVVRIMKF